MAAFLFLYRLYALYVAALEISPSFNVLTFLTQQKFNRPVVVENMGVSGATTGDVLAMITREHKVREVLQAAKIVTITVGGNDLVEAAKLFLANQDKESFTKALARCRQNFR